MASPSTFPVHYERRFWVLLGFIALSLLAHGAAFLLFQVVSPQQVTIPPAAPRVALLTTRTPEQEAILRWVASEDPALAAGSSVAVPPTLFAVPFRPSYAVARTPTRVPAVEAERPAAPPSPITLPLLEAGPREDTVAAAPRHSWPTAVLGEEALASRTFTPGSPLEVKSSAPLQPARFLVLAANKGDANQVFLQRSSGSAAADQAADLYLSRGTFTPPASGTWGFATIIWGEDAYAPSNDAP